MYLVVIAFLAIVLLAVKLTHNYMRVFTQKPILNIPDPSRDRFIHRKIPENIDVIIIGSGIAGLINGCMLAENGNTVLVLEQHYVAGGTLHQYEDQGFTWETGIHYLGNIDGYMLRVIKRYIPNWEVTPILGHFDRIITDDIDFRVYSGWDRYCNDLTQLYPAYKEELLTYVSDLRDALAFSSKLFFIIKFLPKCIRCLAYTLLTQPRHSSQIIREWSQSWRYVSTNSWQKVIDSTFIHDKDGKLQDLKKVLVGQSYNAGSDPCTIPFIIAATVLNHYLNKGGFYPSQGTTNIVTQLCSYINSKGGRVLVSKSVNSIAISNNKVMGVNVNGIMIPCSKIIAACGVNSTLKLLPTLCDYPADIYSHTSIDWMISLRDICDNKCKGKTLYYTLFVGLNEAVQVGCHNTWVHKHDMTLFIGSSHAKLNNGVTDTLVILSPAKWADVAEFENERHKHRSEVYQKLKDNISCRLLQHAIAICPGIDNNIKYMSVSSPLTYNYYFGSVNGEAYGLELNSQRLTPKVGEALSSQTPITGLFLSGQDTFTLGFSGAINSAIVTHIHMSGYISTAHKVL
jgi:all-trans-retinol 13,14-reductase